MYCGQLHTHTPCLYTQQPRPIISNFFCCFPLRLFLKILDMLALNVLAPPSRSSIGQDERGNTQERRSDAPFTIILNQRNRAGKGGKKTRNDFYDCNPLDPFIPLIIWVMYKYIQHLDLYRHIAVCAYIYSNSVENSMTTHIQYRHFFLYLYIRHRFFCILGFLYRTPPQQSRQMDEGTKG